MESCIQSSANSRTIVWLHTAQWGINGNESIERDSWVTKKWDAIQRVCTQSDRCLLVILICECCNGDRITKPSEAKQCQYISYCARYSNGSFVFACKWALIVEMNGRRLVYIRRNEGFFIDFWSLPQLHKFFHAFAISPISFKAPGNFLKCHSFYKVFGNIISQAFQPIHTSIRTHWWLCTDNFDDRVKVV